MRYYSDILDKCFDTEDACRAAEAEASTVEKIYEEDVKVRIKEALEATRKNQESLAYLDELYADKRREARKAYEAEIEAINTAYDEDAGSLKNENTEITKELEKVLKEYEKQNPEYKVFTVSTDDGSSTVTITTGKPKYRVSEIFSEIFPRFFSSFF